MSYALLQRSVSTSLSSIVLCFLLATAFIASGATPAHAQVGQWESVVFVPNWAADTISVVNATTNTVLRTISLPAASGPFSIAASPDGKTAYVVGAYSGRVVVVDAMRGTMVAEIPVGDFPTGSALTRDGGKLYVTDTFGDTLTVIDTQARAVTKVIALPSGQWMGSFPVGLRLRPGTNELWVASQVPGRLDIVNTAVDQIVGTISLPDMSPVAVRFSADGATAAVAGYSGFGLPDAVRIINASTRATVSTYSSTIHSGIGPGVTAVAVAAGGAVYAASVGTVDADFMPVAPYTASITRIDPSGGVTRVASGGSSPGALALSPDGQTVYVSNLTSATIGVLNGQTGNLIATVGVGTLPGFAERFVLPPLPPDPGPVVAMSTFTMTKLLINKKKKTAQVDFSFRLGAGANGFNPVTEPVFLQLNDVWVNVPAGNFVERKRNERWTFVGSISGTPVDFEIKLRPDGSWQYSAIVGPLTHVDLINNPVISTIRIGNDRGTATFTATITQ